jgi:II/X family phage/plasmid replication protein
MIDWLTLKCPPCPGLEIDGGKIVFVNSDGSIDYMVDKFQPVVNSYDDRISIKANSDGVVISGNPSKWLQGHNLFGIENFSRVLHLFIDSISNHIYFDKEWIDKVKSGDFEVNRIDLTYSYRLENQGEVIKWLNAMQCVCSGKRQAASRSKGTTVYFGKHSRRSTIKFYDKQGEINASKEHMLSKRFNDYQVFYLQRWAKGILRCEICLRKKCLKDEFKCYRGKEFLLMCEEDLRSMYMKKLSTVNFSEKFVVSDFDLEKIKPNLRACYTLWQEGYSIREVYCNGSAYNYRKQFKELYNVDIFLQSPKEFRKSAMVIPIMRPLIAVPCEIPWDAETLDLLAV